MLKERVKIIGTIIGNWLVLGDSIIEINKNGKKIRKEKCKCLLCGKEKYVNRQHLINGDTSSCGCWINKISIGDRYGEREVIGEQIGDKVKCKCSCGTIRDVIVGNLKRGGSICCGCIYKTTATHGLSKTSFYNKYYHARSRCNDVKNCRYNNYGGRGIKFEWDSFEGFKNDMYDSYLKHCEEYGEKNTTLDRIDNNGNYCKENCRRATIEEQNNNTQRNKEIEYNGHIYKSISDLCKSIGRYDDREMIGSRIRRGMDIDTAILKPKTNYGKKI